MIMLGISVKSKKVMEWECRGLKTVKYDGFPGLQILAVLLVAFAISLAIASLPADGAEHNFPVVPFANPTPTPTIAPLGYSVWFSTSSDCVVMESVDVEEGSSVTLHLCGSPPPLGDNALVTILDPNDSSAAPTDVSAEGKYHLSKNPVTIDAGDNASESFEFHGEIDVDGDDDTYQL